MAFFFNLIARGPGPKGDPESGSVVTEQSVLGGAFAPSAALGD
jgi:hypothetical protein